MGRPAFQVGRREFQMGGQAFQMQIKRFRWADEKPSFRVVSQFKSGPGDPVAKPRVRSARPNQNCPTTQTLIESSYFN